MTSTTPRTVRQYRRTPEIVEAVQWRGDNLEEIEAFCASDEQKFKNGVLYVWGRHVECWQRAHVNDWIVRGVSGAAFPASEQTFERGYEPVE